MRMSVLLLMVLTFLLVLIVNLIFHSGWSEMFVTFLLVLIVNSIYQFGWSRGANWAIKEYTKKEYTKKLLD